MRGLRRRQDRRAGCACGRRTRRALRRAPTVDEGRLGPAAVRAFGRHHRGADRPGRLGQRQPAPDRLLDAAARRRRLDPAPDDHRARGRLLLRRPRLRPGAARHADPEPTATPRAAPTTRAIRAPTTATCSSSRPRSSGSTSSTTRPQNGAAHTALGAFVWDLTKAYPDAMRGEQCTSADAAGFPIAGLLPTATRSPRATWRTRCASSCRTHAHEGRRLRPPREARGRPDERQPGRPALRRAVPAEGGVRRDAVQRRRSG